METRTMTPAEIAELAALRRRAYGPAADIGTDVAALARLHELERPAVPTRDRTEAEMVPGTEAVATTAPELPAPDDPVDAAAGNSPQSQPTTPVSESAAVGPRSLARIRRFGHRHPLVAAVGVTVLAAVVTGSATLVAQDRPDTVLRAVDDPPAAPALLLGAGMFDYLGIDADDEPIGYGVYAGLDVYAVPHLGGHCLFIASDERYFDFACGRGGLDPIVDMRVGVEVSNEGLGVPTDTLLRFIHRGDEVEVWIGEPDSPPTT